MAKDVRKATPAAGLENSAAGADAGMAEFLESLGLAQSEQLTFNQWKPALNERRAFLFLGTKMVKSDLGENKDFAVVIARDLKTQESFSFVAGGLFMHIIESQGIKAGDGLAVQYKGKIDLDGKPANQWIIIKVKER